MRRIILETPAKINLFLEITGKRPDGYHLLSTVFQAVGMYDTLLLERKDDPGIVLREEEGIAVPLDRTNLIDRAAELLFLKYGLPGGLRVRLKKRIFTGAGLGGGSSDAAATLYGVNRLFDLGLSKEELKSYGVSLGADVPFFFEGGARLAAGIGEELTRLPEREPFDLVILKPEVSASTAEIFRRFDRTEKRTTRSSDGAVRAFYGPEDAFLPAVSASLYNALGPVTEELVPEIGEMRALLLENGALSALMSGSGSSVFGVFRDRKTAENALNAARESGRFRAAAVRSVPDGIRETERF